MASIYIATDSSIDELPSINLEKLKHLSQSVEFNPIALSNSMPLSNESVIALVSIVISLPAAVLVIWKLLQRYRRDNVGSIITIKLSNVLHVVILTVSSTDESTHEQQGASGSNFALVFVVGATERVDSAR